ncbi:MAG: ATP-binding domain-containing protein, partial [Clostridiales bacterium]|nr:ATP-binding domain-containing protein [Clostridiales bacterium]
DKSKIKYFRKGDYITVKKNEYDMVDDFDEVTQLINGDLGYVESTTKTKLTFSVGKHRYTIDKSEINELLDHAWAITIHKSQGGQANIVIIVLPYNSYFMLSANMLYTAITRTQSKCYVIGDFRGINKAAKVQANFTRKTMIQFQSENRVVAK